MIPAISSIPVNFNTFTISSTSCTVMYCSKSRSGEDV